MTTRSNGYRSSLDTRIKKYMEENPDWTEVGALSYRFNLSPRMFSSIVKSWTCIEKRKKSNNGVEYRWIGEQ